ncbi:hypothetical protein [Methanosarcina horonobensis]|uniref:hypothetical protein n=1 Tax=Methanosarcina horonobensis TaxID=418008 RepID=UPI0009E37D16|nr:hypothetical protein [Methanosarcina horonobensis]
MKNFDIHKFCSACDTRLKRQVMGSNVFYYCRSCGRVSSEACLSGGVNMLRVQRPLSAHRVSSTADFNLSKNTLKTMVET